MKKPAILLLCVIPMLMACSKTPTNPADLEAAAQAKGFSIKKLDPANAYQFTKDNCTVEFEFNGSQADAERKFFKLASEAKNRGGGASAEVNMTNYHYYSKSSGALYFYATQVESTLFLFDGDKNCKDAVKDFADAIHY